jgi:succinate dehydrogenase / fumarate reductase cytochrome b subunit
MDNNNPLSPHIQIYRWHISSLVSISHRITGIVNIFAITVICFWIFSLLLGESSYDLTKLFLQSIFGKFIIICLTWSFSFQTLSEIRHLIMDLGYGFELKTSKVTGLLVILGSVCLTIIFYLLGRNFI